MTLLDFWKTLTSAEQGIVIGLLIMLLGSIKIKPIELNLWQWLARKIGNALNGDMIDKLNVIEERQKEMEAKFDKHVAADEENKALENRQMILRFAREILTGQKHTKEDFIEMLDVVQSYEDYCSEHPRFPNKRAVFAAKLIQDNYQERLEKADFLAEEYRCQLVEEDQK